MRTLRAIPLVLALLPIWACSAATDDSVGETEAADSVPADRRWGLLVTPDGAGTPLKSTYFFPGNAFKQWETSYAFYPNDPAYLAWDDSAANREDITNQMSAAGLNTVVMSFYYKYCCAPMYQNDAPYQGRATVINWGAFDGLFDAASAPKRPLQIIPSVEIPDQPPTHFAKPDDTVTLDSVNALVERYLIQPRDPAWPSRWAQAYGRDGKPRYVIELIALAADALGPEDHQKFVAALDHIATMIKVRHRVDIGFLVGPGRSANGYTPIPCTPDRGDACTHFENARSFLGIQDYFTELDRGTGQIAMDEPYTDNNGLLPSDPPHAPGSPDPKNAPNRETIARFKRAEYAAWIAQGLPTMLDVSGGYDGRYSFGWEKGRGAGYWGDNATYYDDWWRNYMSEMKGMGNKGITYSSWNAFTEGGTAMPARRVTRIYHPLGILNVPNGYGPFDLYLESDGHWDSVRTDWLTDALLDDPRECSHYHFVDGFARYHVYGAICQKWQALGGIIDFGAPSSGEEPTRMKNRVTYFTKNGYESAIYFKSAAFEVHGAIYAKYKSMGEDASYLGAPTSDELPSGAWCPGHGSYNAFEHGWIDFCDDGRVWAHSDPTQGFPGRDF